MRRESFNVVLKVEAQGGYMVIIFDAESVHELVESVTKRFTL